MEKGICRWCGASKVFQHLTGHERHCFYRLKVCQHCKAVTKGLMPKTREAHMKRCAEIAAQKAEKEETVGAPS